MNTQVITPPPSFNANEWRQQLAGLIDPDYSTPLDDNKAAAEHKKWAIGLCLACCDLFGESLDRMTLWDRIPSGLATACVKCDDGDIDRFVDYVLSHIKAEPARAARHEDVGIMLAEASMKPTSWRQGLVRYIASHGFAIIAYSRREWETTKEQRRDAKALKEGGILSTGELVTKGGAA